MIFQSTTQNNDTSQRQCFKSVSKSCVLPRNYKCFEVQIQEIDANENREVKYNVVFDGYDEMKLCCYQKKMFVQSKEENTIQPS